MFLGLNNLVFEGNAKSVTSKNGSTPTSPYNPIRTRGDGVCTYTNGNPESIAIRNTLSTSRKNGSTPTSPSNPIGTRRNTICTFTNGNPESISISNT